MDNGTKVIVMPQNPYEMDQEGRTGEIVGSFDTEEGIVYNVKIGGTMGFILNLTQWEIRRIG